MATADTDSVLDRSEPDYISACATAECPLTKALFVDPVEGADGYVYEKAAFVEWVEAHSTSPTTGEPLASKDFKPCVVTKHCAAAWRAYAAARDHTNDDADDAGAAEIATHHRDAPRIASNLLANLKVLDLKLQELGLTDVQKPCIVVIGQQSAGKSTLLEVLVGCALFPRDEKLCTKMRIRVMLERSDSDKWDTPPEIRIVPTDPAAAAQLPIRMRKFPPQLPFDHLPEVLRKVMDDVAATSNSGFVTDREIEVRVKAPFGMQLELVDLPGLPGKDGDPRLDDAKKLIEMSIEQLKDTASFLWVRDVNEDMSSSKIGEILLSKGVADRTFGVGTKLDKVKPENPDALLLECIRAKLQQTHKAVQRQWYGVSSRADPNIVEERFAKRGGRGSKELHRLLLIEETEEHFIKNELDHLGAPAEVRATLEFIGQRKLQQLLQTEAYEKFTTERWVPHVKARIIESMKNQFDDLVRLGLPFGTVFSPDSEAMWSEVKRFAVAHHAIMAYPATQAAVECDHSSEAFRQRLMAHVTSCARKFSIHDDIKSPNAVPNSSAFAEVFDRFRVRVETVAATPAPELAVEGDWDTVVKCDVINGKVIDAVETFATACAALPLSSAMADLICRRDPGDVPQGGAFVAERCNRAIPFLEERLQVVWNEARLDDRLKSLSSAYTATRGWAYVQSPPNHRAVTVRGADLAAFVDATYNAVQLAVKQCLVKAVDELDVALADERRATLLVEDDSTIELRRKGITLIKNLGQLVEAIDQHQLLQKPNTSATGQPSLVSDRPGDSQVSKNRFPVTTSDLPARPPGTSTATGPSPASAPTMRDQPPRSPTTSAAPSGTNASTVSTVPTEQQRVGTATTDPTTLAALPTVDAPQ